MTRSQACVPLPNLAMPNEGGLSAQRMRIIPVTLVPGTTHAWLCGVRIAVWTWIPLLSREVSPNE
jgi:hypothetical protein